MSLEMEIISWIQASSRPEYKRPGVQSPVVQSTSAQASRAQASRVRNRLAVQSPNVQTVSPEPRFSDMPNKYQLTLN